MHYQDENIRLYAAGDLSPEALLAFEKDLATDEGLKEDAEIYLALKADDNLRHKKRFHALITENQLQSEKPQEEARIISFFQQKKTWLAMAASIILLAALAWYFVPDSQNSPRFMAQTYLSDHYPAPSNTMGSDEGSENWKAAKKYWQNNDYQGVMNSILAIKQPTDEQNFYLGLAYLYPENPNYNTAIQTFSSVGGVYTEPALWYRALALVQLDRKAEARTLLQQIKNPSRQEKVQRLLKVL